MIRLAVLATGTGTNAENLIKYFTGHALISVTLVLTNNPEAKVLQKAARHQVEAKVFTRDYWSRPGIILEFLFSRQIDYLILAGFLIKIKPEIVEAYPGKILNIHPALLPRYGGKGMYGEKVHRAVLLNGDQESGITIHVVDVNYDEGRILFQATCPVMPDDSVETLARRVHELEYRHYPRVTEKYIFPGRQTG